MSMGLTETIVQLVLALKIELKTGIKQILSFAGQKVDASLRFRQVKFIDSQR